jgi:hypothetical protein
MNYGDTLPSCSKGVQHFEEKDIGVILYLYPKKVVDGKEMLRWACIGTFCKDYVDCYSKAYLESVKEK